MYAGLPQGHPTPLGHTPQLSCWVHTPAQNITSHSSVWTGTQSFLFSTIFDKLLIALTGNVCYIHH